MFDSCFSEEALELTTIIYKGNRIKDVPVVYQMDGGGAFFVNVSRKDYKILYLPFYYKKQPVIFK